jgi:hypothetical protein
MIRLREFVDMYKKFMRWLKTRHKDPTEYVKQFEKIFSVTNETQLLREIQDMKDELNMLSAVFRDQNGVLTKVGGHIDMSRDVLSKAGSGKDGAGSESSLETSPSAFSFQQQSEKHAGHIDRMKDQANQAYNNVSVVFSKDTGVLTYGD